MRLKQMIPAAAWTMAVTLAGCEMKYNGSWDAASAPPRIEPPTPAAQQHAQAANAQTAAGPQAAAVHPVSDTHGREIQFETPADVNFDGGAQPASSDRSAAGVRQVGLFGQLANSTGGKASSLDSPDNIRRVTFSTEGADFDPDVDPQGQWLAYASTQHRATADLYLKRVDGTTVTQLTNDPSNDVMPSFSPDGKRIAFASDRAGNWDIYIMDVAGGQAVQLTADATDDVHPSFSPDGRQIVYCSKGSQSGQWELVVVDVESPATKRFIGYGLLPQWAPQGNKIVFQKARERGSRAFSVWTVDYVNGEGVRPTEIAASSNAAVITPSFSPDGNHIVFCTVVDLTADETQRPQQADIWLVAADGTGRANLTHSPFANLQPVWAKDGSIYFVSNRGQKSRENIYAIRPDRAIGVTQTGTVASTPAPAPTAAATPTNNTAAGTQELTGGATATADDTRTQDAPGSPAASATTAEVPTVP